MEELLNTWKGYFTFAALLSCFVNLLQLTFSFYMFAIYRNVVISYSEDSLVCITVAAIYALVFLGIFHYVRSRLLTRAGSQVYARLRTRVQKGMLNAHVVSRGGSYSQGGADLETLRDFFSGNAVNSLFDAPWAPFYLLLIYFIHPGLGFIATAGTVLVIALSALQEFLIRSSMTNANRWNSRNQRFVNAFLRNTEVINGMGMSAAVSDWFERNNRRVIWNQTRSSNYAGSIQAVIKPMQNVLQVLIYCAGAYYAMTAGFSVGLMVAASIIMGRGLAPVLQVTATWKLTVQAREAYRRLFAFEQILDRQRDKMPLFVPQGRFQLSGATYATDGRALLAGVSFSLEPGEFLGIIGPSGAGKTTLCRLMLGIWPCTSGKVYLDGLDAFLWDKEIIGKNIGYLPQEIELFPVTLAENIARLGMVDNEKLAAVVDLCGLKPLVESLPAGYDTLLEREDGVKLSGGQKQLVGLAMALYNSPSILVLDEPTSNLDEETEKIFLAVLQRLKTEGETTCLMVTHKPALLQSMDKIVVLQQGRLAFGGTKEEVFARLSGQPVATQEEAR